jgi:cell division protein FtsZ
MTGHNEPGHAARNEEPRVQPQVQAQPRVQAPSQAASQPAPRQAEDPDQERIEIPAFLRRQAN